MSRREFLHAGAAAGLALAGGMHIGAALLGAADLRPRANCIFIANTGGMSQLDLWDPKPGAPAEIRGAFSPIHTNVPGLFISELLPHTARIADKLAIVRGMTHEETEHIPASRLMMAGCELLMSEYRHRDLELCGSATFDISREPDSARQAYGDSDLGRQCLKACRMVEAGRPLVTIRNGHWDTHSQNAWCLKELLAPSLDQALSALVVDLGQRGLLDSTLVVVATEFGRSPRINSRAGRDHWPAAFSIVMAGGGIDGGRAVGATDAHGRRVIDRPIIPADLTFQFDARSPFNN